MFVTNLPLLFSITMVENTFNIIIKTNFCEHKQLISEIGYKRNQHTNDHAFYKMPGIGRLKWYVINVNRNINLYRDKHTL